MAQPEQRRAIEALPSGHTLRSLLDLPVGADLPVPVDIAPTPPDTTIDLTAFNTDGFDFTGRNVHVHDCSVWCQDDTFCVKDLTENVLVENVNASGVGLTIGSINSDGVPPRLSLAACDFDDF